MHTDWCIEKLYTNVKRRMNKTKEVCPSTWKLKDSGWEGLSKGNG
jgi:hypothetical protein